MTITLINEKTLHPVKVGDTVTSFRGEAHTVTGWAQPHKPSSTGRVYTNAGEYFPGVYSLKFVDVVLH